VPDARRRSASGRPFSDSSKTKKLLSLYFRKLLINKLPALHRFYIQRPSNSSTRVIPIIDLSDEDTISYNEYFNPYDPVEDSILESPLHQDIINREPPEIIDLEPDLPANQGREANLEPLNPDLEYQRNIQRMFITLDEYARNIYTRTSGLYFHSIKS